MKKLERARKEEEEKETKEHEKEERKKQRQKEKDKRCVIRRQIKEQGERKANLMTEIMIATWNVEYALMRRMT